MTPTRRPCLFCADSEAVHYWPGNVPIRVTNVDPPRLEWEKCKPCDGRGWVVMKGSFVDNR